MLLKTVAIFKGKQIRITRWDLNILLQQQGNGQYLHALFQYVLSFFSGSCNQYLFKLYKNKVSLDNFGRNNYSKY